MLVLGTKILRTKIPVIGVIAFSTGANSRGALILQAINALREVGFGHTRLVSYGVLGSSCSYS